MCSGVFQSRLGMSENWLCSCHPNIGGKKLSEEKVLKRSKTENVLFYYVLKCGACSKKVHSTYPLAGFVKFIIQMFGSSEKSVERKPLKDANFPCVYVYVYKCMYVLICLQASRGRCAKTELSLYWLCETKSKQ